MSDREREERDGLTGLTQSHTHSLTHSLTHSHSLTHTHSLTRSLTHTNTHTHTRSLTHSHEHTLTHSLTRTHTHTNTLTHTHSRTHKRTHGRGINNPGCMNASHRSRAERWTDVGKSFLCCPRHVEGGDWTHPLDCSFTHSSTVARRFRFAIACACACVWLLFCGLCCVVSVFATLLVCPLNLLEF